MFYVRTFWRFFINNSIYVQKYKKDASLYNLTLIEYIMLTLPITNDQYNWTMLLLACSLTCSITYTYIIS